MPAPHPPEFRQRAIELAREGAKPVRFGGHGVFVFWVAWLAVGW
jgi:hypothetical protein